MNLGLMVQIPVPVQIPICSVCRQATINLRRRVEQEGAVYVVCPRCRQEVDDHRDRNYRARARRWLRMLQKEWQEYEAKVGVEEAAFIRAWMRSHERIFHI